MISKPTEYDHIIARTFQRIGQFSQIGRAIVAFNSLNHLARGRWFLENVEVNKNDVVLDLCGYFGRFGGHLKKVLKKEFDYTCLDKDTSMGQKYFNFFTGHDCKFVCHNLGDGLPFDDNTFTQVWFIAWWHQDIDDNFVFNEINRVLKPGGTLIFDRTTVKDVHHRMPYDENSVTKLMNNTNFEIIKLDTYQYGREYLILKCKKRRKENEI